MSIGLETQRIGWDARSEHWGDDVQWVGSMGPVKIRGTVLPLGQIEAETLFSMDVRANAMIQIGRDVLAGKEILPGHFITMGSDRWRIVARDLNPADTIQGTYGLLEVAAGKDK